MPSENSYWRQYKKHIEAISPRKKSGDELKKVEILIPTVIFLERKLSFSEALVEYLKEVYGFSYHQIAVLTSRDERNIWTIYSRTARKRKGMPYMARPAEKNVFFPLSILKDRTASPLETVAFYLKSKGLQNREIAFLLERSSKTVWTVIERTRQKIANNKTASKSNAAKRGGADE